MTMSDSSELSRIERLEPLIGEWQMHAVFPSSSPIETSEARGAARTVFEWLPGRQFVVQRWEVPHPAAPDGIAIIGFDRGRGTYLQHYFDSRGVARRYEMSFAEGVWTFSRTEADCSPLDFSQRATPGSSATTAARSAEAGSPRTTAGRGCTTSNSSTPKPPERRAVHA